ncbi:MAG TPA: hypothetical protein VNY51_13385 [Candidatus Dormibacteraeota bacterium]|nr:hypothetical protein [Candidatus Dormibacteraeota bacterium]
MAGTGFIGSGFQISLSNPNGPSLRAQAGGLTGSGNQQGSAPAGPQPGYPNPENAVGRLQAKPTVTVRPLQHK